MTEFKDLGLSSEALRAVERLGYVEPTPVQEEAIPKILAGSDIIAAASTGTGKTAAFLLPCADKTSKAKKGPRAPRILVITPTRELAEQIARISFKVSRACGLFTTVVYGGKPYAPQISELRRGTDILIATPGRLCDLMDRGVVDLSGIEILILDEADRMLDMGFLPDVKRIVSDIPDNRQTLLFSATIDASIKNNLSDLLHDPETIQIAQRGETSKIVDQYILPVSQKDKPELLKCLLDEKGHERVIVFARTKSRVEEVASALSSAGFAVDSIHSDKTQGQRRRALNNFRKGNCGVIVATDVLARGIDIPEVDYVVNYDLPDMSEDYIHRIGRTGRAGHHGFAVSFVSSNSLKLLDAIERLVGKQIPVFRMDSFDLDMSILKRHGGQAASSKEPRKGRPKKKKQKAAQYNYEGWGDKRTGAKRKRTSASPANPEGAGQAKPRRKPGKGSGTASRKKGSENPTRDDRTRGNGKDASRRRASGKGGPSKGRSSRSQMRRQGARPSSDGRRKGNSNARNGNPKGRYKGSGRKR